jgi:hypothetical protein
MKYANKRIDKAVVFLRKVFFEVIKTASSFNIPKGKIYIGYFAKI